MTDEPTDISTDPEPTELEQLRATVDTALETALTMLAVMRDSQAESVDPRAIRTIRGPRGERVQVVKGRAAMRQVGGRGYGQ
jgi:hypothetical protein